MLCNNKKCFGCYACANICPCGAIQLKENSDGAPVPAIQKDKCINCHACEKVCPALNLPKGHLPQKCYAAWSRDNNIAETSASGGIVSTVYNWNAEQGGVSVGTEYVDGQLVFACSDTSDASKRFSGSKYTHAVVGYAYKKVKQLLKDERKVVFAGTPCQVAGLRSYLGKCYDNLLLIDLICHGVPPQKYLQEYVSNICKQDFDKVLFRGEQGNKIAVYKNEELIYCKEKWYDAYSMAYAKGLISRENCFHCPFASPERQGDITVGDFWGLKKEQLRTDAVPASFISLVLINTEKGQSVFDAISKDIIFEERAVDEAVRGNEQLKSPCKRSEERELFLDKYMQEGFVKALKSTQIYKDTKRADTINQIKKPFRFIKKKINGGK
ncbi:MAG: Coenzyme F420 hydrogenase/dehydrogenase, beta subunit C-terminal domain [Ruminococcus sp.]